MVSNQVLQKTLDGLTQISKIGLCIIDTEGGILASTSDEARQMSEAAKVFSLTKGCNTVHIKSVFRENTAQGVFYPVVYYERHSVHSS